MPQHLESEPFPSKQLEVILQGATRRQCPHAIAIPVARGLQRLYDEAPEVKGVVAQN